MSIAWVFPGQGSQKIGMANAVLSLPEAKDRFEFVSNLLNRDLIEICQRNSNGNPDPNELNKTENTQPALFTIESLLVDDLHRQGREASLVAGHSLGELVALFAAGAFDFVTGIKLIHKRSSLMAASKDGAMTAVIGFDRCQLEDLVEATDGVVIANDNSSGQVVLSGTPEAIQKVSNSLKCKRAIPLPVSGAFHSPFMESAAKKFAEELDLVIFKNTKIPVLSNSEPTPTCEAEVLKNRLKQQMTTGVRWRESMDEMSKAGIKNIIEIGPGNVLSGLAKRSIAGISTNQIASASDLGH